MKRKIFLTVLCQKKWPEETAARRVFLSHFLVEHIIGNNQFYFHVCFLAREKLEFFQGEDRKLSLVVQGNWVLLSDKWSRVLFVKEWVNRVILGPSLHETNSLSAYKWTLSAFEHFALNKGWFTVLLLYQPTWHRQWTTNGRFFFKIP